MSATIPSEWGTYSDVYDLLDQVPAFQELRKRHVHAMSGLDEVFDGGCGTGLITSHLAEQNKHVVAVDSSKDMLEQARKRLQYHSNVQLSVADVCALPFPSHIFDGYVSNNVLHFVADDESFFDEASRVLKPGGVLSLASARPCCDMDVMVNELFTYFRSQKAPEEIMDQIHQIADSNRALMQYLHNNHDLEGVTKLLHQGRFDILEEGSAYMNQSFYVIAKKGMEK